eukprot:2691_1
MSIRFNFNSGNQTINGDVHSFTDNQQHKQQHTYNYNITSSNTNTEPDKVHMVNNITPTPIATAKQDKPVKSNISHPPQIKKNSKKRAPKKKNISSNKNKKHKEEIIDTFVTASWTQKQITDFW